MESLKIANVGMAMGTGCAAAKEVSDMILTENDFEATIKSIMWGRNIYHNVGRFLQFQITVNLTAVLTIFFGAMYLGESPLTAV